MKCVGVVRVYWCGGNAVRVWLIGKQTQQVRHVNSASKGIGVRIPPEADTMNCAYNLNAGREPHRKLYRE